MRKKRGRDMICWDLTSYSFWVRVRKKRGRGMITTDHRNRKIYPSMSNLLVNDCVVVYLASIATIRW